MPYQDKTVSKYAGIDLGRAHIQPDLEKVVNRPQAENSEFYNVLKIA